MMDTQKVRRSVFKFLGDEYGIGVIEAHNVLERLSREEKILTKRERFAGLALQGFLANPHCGLKDRKIAEYSVKFADDLIAELGK